MSNRYITMNSVQYNPTSVSMSLPKVGESRRMADGTLKYYHRANKRTWEIAWTALNENNAQYAAVETLAALSSSFTFVDYAGTSYTVLILPDNFTKNISAEKVSTAYVKYYDITLTLTEV